MRTREAALVCPGCGTRVPVPGPEAARFCPECGLPLVYADAPEPDAPAARDPRRRWLQKVKPQLAEGPLVKVAWVRNQAEGEWVQGLLLEVGVPSLLRRTAGFDVPDMLAAGPRDVMAPAAGVDTAREVLLDAGVIRGPEPGDRGRTAAPPPGRLLAGLCLALALGAGLIALVSLLVH